MDHTQLVVFGLGEDGVDGHPQLVNEVLEPGVGRGLQGDRVPCQEDAPGFVLVPVVPALLFRQLDRGGGAGGEGDLVDFSGSFDGEAGYPECLLDCGDVLVHLGDGTEPDLAENEDQALGGERVLPAFSLHCCSLGLHVTLHWGYSGKLNWLPLGARWVVWGARMGWV